MSSINWHQTTLGRCVDLLTGFAFASDQYIQPSTLSIRLLRGDNIAPGSLRWDDAKHYANSHDLARYKLNLGDIVIALDRPIVGAGLKCATVKADDLPCLLVQRVARLRANEMIVQGYLAQTLQTHRFISHLKNKKTATAVPHISPNDIRDYQVDIPNKSEQKEITRILETWDQSISIAERLIACSLKQKQALMQKLLSGKTRLKGYSKPWSELRLGQVLTSVKRPVIWDDQFVYPLISVRRRSGGAFHRESLYGHEILTKKLNRVEVGDFLISKMQVVHGAMAMVPPDLAHMYVSDSYLTMKSADETKVDIDYIGWLSATPLMYRAAYRSSYGVHIEKMTFDLEMFFQEKVRIPSDIAEQREICTVLNLAGQEVQLLEHHLEQLRAEKLALVQQLLTGKRRVHLSSFATEAAA